MKKNEKFDGVKMPRKTIDFDVTGSDEEVDAIIILMKAIDVAIISSRELEHERKLAIMSYIQSRTDAIIRAQRPVF